jgi:hypothetical protein
MKQPLVTPPQALFSAAFALLCLRCSDAPPSRTNPSPGAPVAGSSGAAPEGGRGGSVGVGAGAGGGGVTSAGGSAIAGRGGVNGESGSGGASGAAAGSAAQAGAGGGAPLPVEPGLVKDEEVRLTSAGLSLVSYGGYLNGESFQQEGILTHEGYQYTAFWNTARHVVMARRPLPDGAWSSFEFSDYTNTEADAHNTISLGISPADGTLHVAFDHHSSTLHYRRSMNGLVAEPALASWTAASFGAVSSSLVAGTAITELTYPRFVTEPGGAKMLFSARLGTSGSGDEHLWEYDASLHTWTSLGKYLDGIVDNVNAYPHGLSYGVSSKRLHVSWCWRDTSNASTNHDLLYLYSDDDGRTWLNNEGVSVATTGSQAARQNTAGINVWKIAQNRGLINQEHMVVDALGRVHVLLSHLPDAQANDSSFDSARSKSQYFHYFRGTDGKWSKTALGQPAVLNFRGKLAVSSSNNLYAVLPDLRIAAAAASNAFASWQLLEQGQAGRFFSDPLIDATRLLSEDKLSVVYPEKASPNIFVIDYSLD